MDVMEVVADTEHPRAPSAPLHSRTAFLHRQKELPVPEETQSQSDLESEEPVVSSIHPYHLT
jgi:hypothetical protein